MPLMMPTKHIDWNNATHKPSQIIKLMNKYFMSEYSNYNNN